ncbi:thiolase domain-containing protein [Haloprofundus sp. MHR1]|uniref:thiolase domain-containing protein n=1 Tax=Haloprofundus sp. MHR1 TaxID=2572921 RepID=UPI0010BE86BF|nr:thiolase domain-containing protein [Haloprofundus sp. MHR1]QCJ47114.1 thiolase domain-containing protein [Haloprofundus sp. MHR1]
MNDVCVVGTGTTEFGVREEGIVELGVTAVGRALRSCDVDREDVDALYLGNFVAGMLEGQETLAPLVADSVGLVGVPTMKTEGACASSGIAFRQAYQAIRTGIHDVVVVTGVERMTSAETSEFTRALGSAADHGTDGATGLTFPGFYGLVLDRYMHEYGATREQVAAVSVKNRRNGASNPRARFRSPVTVEDVVDSRLVADPLRLYDCCPAADGAAAVVLASADVADSYTDAPIPVLGSGHATGRSAAYRYDDLTTLEATTLAAEEAYDEANISPSDVDVVELHDCFSAAEIGDSEDLGFFEKGEGAAAVAEGRTAVDGEVPINPSGGLLAKGHPVGATGIGQIYEVCLQLLGEHENQVDGAEVGLAHNLGGSGAVSTVTVLGGPSRV